MHIMKDIRKGVLYFFTDDGIQYGINSFRLLIVPGFFYECFLPHTRIANLPLQPLTNKWKNTGLGHSAEDGI
jgi:hypothetical protein